MAITTHTGGERLIETKRRAIANFQEIITVSTLSAVPYNLNLGGLTLLSFRKECQANFDQFVVDGITTVGVRASTILSMAVNPTATDTFVLAGDEYTFVDADPGGLEILIGIDLPATKLAVIAAINGTDGINTRNSDAFSGPFIGNDVEIFARLTGTDGNALTSESSFTSGSNSFNGLVFSGGVDEVALVSGLKNVAEADRIYELRKDFNTNFAILEIALTP